MKKQIIAILMLAVLLLGGCAQAPADNTSSEEEKMPTSSLEESSEQTPSDTPSSEAAKEPSISLGEIIEAVYAGIDEMPMVGNMTIDAENESYYLGTTGLNFTEAIASEAMISSIAHSVCVVRMAEGEDIEAAKEAIRTSVDPRKWICVGVEDDEVIVDNIGNTIILIMTQASPETIHENFLALAE